MIRRFVAPLGIILLALSIQPQEPAHSAEGQSSARSPYRIVIRSSINPATADYLSHALKRAQADESPYLIVELDTPGGLLSTTRLMAQEIQNSKVPVVFFVHPAGASATSAGALLMLAAHLAVMAPGTNVGAAHPVGTQGEEIQGAAGEKATNDTAAFARGLAELRGRSRDLAEGVVSKSKSYTAEEALKGGLIDLIATDIPSLVKQLQGRSIRLAGGSVKISAENLNVRSTEDVPVLQMNLGQRLLNLLANPNIAAILMSLGLLLIYVELSNPGITVAGVLGGITLLIAFMAFQLLPIHTGGVALVLLGLVLLAAEPFVVSHGALAAGGVLSFILGLIWLTDRSMTSLHVSPSVWIPLAVGMGSGVAVIGIAAARTLQLSHETLSRIGGGAASGLAGYLGRVEKVGSDPRKGKALFRGELWEIVSESPLKVGDEVEVTSTDALVAKVRQK